MILVSLLLSLISLSLVSTSSARLNSTNTTITDWSEISPSPSITWVPCFTNFTCTRLLVPLDYENGSVGTAAIAFIKYTPKNATKDAKDILINPGGPGGSGINIILTDYSQFSHIFGPDYNLVGFDPRGVQHSGPSTDCFSGDFKIAEDFVVERGRRNPINSEEDLNAQFDMLSAYGPFCAARLNRTVSYVGTTAVARDLVQYAEQAAILRGQSAQTASIYYAGFSYGSILGTTLATPYPSLIGRMWLDGVASAPEYYDGTWATFQVDTDAAISSFFTSCFDAGPIRCVYYSASSPSAIQTRYLALEAHLKEHPISVFNLSVVEVPQFATWNHLRLAFLNAAYTPQRSFPAMAQILLDLEHRNGSSLLSFMRATAVPCYECEKKTALQYSADLALIPIECADRAGRGGLPSVEAFRDDLKVRLRISSYAGEYGSEHVLFCRGWGFGPPESQRFDASTLGTNHTVPILFTSNTIDPVTPLQQARAMSSLFPNSRLLLNNAVAHTTFSAPSTCIFEHVRSYFDGLELPAQNTTCEPDKVPFS